MLIICLYFYSLISFPLHILNTLDFQRNNKEINLKDEKILFRTFPIQNENSKNTSLTINTGKKIKCQV